MVPVAGVEPARCCHRWILNPVRLPIPSHRQVYFHEIASKTKPWKSEVDLEVDFEKTVFFNFQEPSKIKGFQPLEREAAQRILSPSRLPIPSHRPADMYYSRPDDEIQEFFNILPNFFLYVHAGLTSYLFKSYRKMCFYFISSSFD